MVDWLAVWGVYTVAGFVFKDVLAPLAKGALEDYVKDFFKDSIKDFRGLFERDTLQKVVGKALKEFLQLVQQELEDADLSEAELQLYIKPLKQFISNQSVKEILGSAFKEDFQYLDTRRLIQIWNDLSLRSLPNEFDWEQVAKRYLKKVKAIIRESEDLRAILDSQNLESIEKTNKEIAGIIPDFDLSRYREGIREQYGNLKLESLDTSGYAYNELKLWRMFVAQNVREVDQPQIHEIPKEHQKRPRESNQLEAEISTEELERYKQVYLQQPIRSVLQIVEGRVGAYGIVGAQRRVPLRRMMILGDPGSGKSTLLQYLALKWAEEPLKDLSLQPIPLVIELRTYIRNWDSQQCKDFLEFFHQGSGIICHLNQHQLHERLKAGNAIVMFDGLDEVFDRAKRENVIRDIICFTNEYPKVRVIVTSRVIDNNKFQELKNAKFRHFRLQNLESEQIKDFINRWHNLTFKDEADKVIKRERLQTAIDTSSSIRELVGNPLLLTMMAILNRNQELPRDRPILYEKASELLLHQWDVEQKLLTVPDIDPYTIDLKDKQAMLRQVAYSMQAVENGLAGNSIKAHDLQGILTNYLKDRVDKPIRVARLMIEQLQNRNFILCFMGADYYAFVHRTFLEYFCAWEFVWQFKETQTLSLEKLKTEVFGKHWQDESWHEVLRLIGAMIEPKFTGEIIDYLIYQNSEEEKFINLFLAAGCLSEVRNRNAIVEIDNKLFEQIKVLTEYKETKEGLKGKDLLRIEKIRNQAITALATNWKSKLETLSLLKSIAQSNDIWSGAGVAVRELARGWKDKPNTLSILKTIAQSNQNLSVPSIAVQEVAQRWKNDSDTLPWLRSLAQSARSEFVRAKAVQELASGWKEDQDTLPILKTIAQSDSDWDVRQTTIQELASGWKDEPSIFEFLCDRAVNDPFKREKDSEDNPRQTALEAIIEHYPDNPQTLPLLRDRTDNDPDERIREFARDKLRKWGATK